MAGATARSRLGGLVVAAVASAAGMGPTTALAAPPAAQSIHTSRAKFRIPFQYDADEMARLGAVEIRLFVSTDRGRHWQHAQSVAPVEGKFTFEASGDGEYWFAVRTVDAQGQLHPPGPPQSGLQVVVDRTPPQLEIRLREPRPGQVELTWRAIDEHLDLSSLKLEFLDPGAVNWQAVSVTPSASGQTSWTVPAGGRVIVRATVADKAGNSATADAATGTDAAAPAQPAGKPQTPKPDFSRPVAGQDPFSEIEESLVLDEAPVVIPNGGPLPPHSPTPAPNAVTPRPVSGPVQTPVVADASRTGTAFDPSEPGEESTPVRYVRSREFSFYYELQDVGSSGVSSVDLYITEDDGRKWYYYGPDDDRQSPMAVEVPADGTYGFALRVRSGAGLTQNPPQPGDPPAFVVVVDRQPPRAELRPHAPAEGLSRGEVVIEWQVSDERLAERPVRLSWGATREGPWQNITDWIENTGRYRWSVDESLAPSVYLRLEARDAAGNISRAESSAPLVLDASRPSARITDVEPATTPQ